MGSCTWENSGTRDEKVGSITLGESTITSARPGLACGDRIYQRERPEVVPFTPWWFRYGLYIVNERPIAGRS